MALMRSGEKPWRSRPIGIDAVAARLARRHHYRERRHVLRDHGVRADIGVAADAAELVHQAEAPTVA